MFTKKILLTGGRAPSTLEFSRLFSKEGHIVHIADSVPFAISRYSRFVKKFHHTHKPKQETPLFIEDIVRIIKHENIDLLVPTCEEIFYLAKHQDLFKDLCEVWIDDFEKLLTLHHKYEFINLADSIGLSVPKTRLVTNKYEWENVCELEQNKKIAKPVFSRFSNTLFYLPKDKNASFDINTSNPWVVQDFIEGDLYCSYSIAKNGEIIAHSVYKSEYRAGDGASIYFEHHSKSKIDKWVEQFVKSIHFSGQIAFDFIERNDGEVFAIECNPRLTSGIHLFRNTSLISVLLNKSKKRIVPTPSQSVALKGAMVLFAKQNKTKHYWSDWKNASDAVWMKEDKTPFFSQALSLYGFSRISKKEKITLLEATTFDISWDGDL